jgi:hypothetical protein
MRCPVCKADNDRGPQCRRCRADLSLLFALEEQRSQALNLATRHLQCGRWQEAKGSLDRVSDLRSGEDVVRLRAVLALLHRDYATAWREHQAAAASAR